MGCGMGRRWCFGSTWWIGRVSDGREGQRRGTVNTAVRMAKMWAEDEMPVWEEIESREWWAVDAVEPAGPVLSL